MENKTNVSIFTDAALELLKEAISKAGYSEEIVIGMDVAASEFFRDGKYDLDFKSPDDPTRYITPDELADIYRGFVKDYPGIFLAFSFKTESTFLSAHQVQCLLLVSHCSARMKKILRIFLTCKFKRIGLKTVMV